MSRCEFTPAEAAAFVGLTAKRVRNELEKGIVARAGRAPRLVFEDLVYLRALVEFDELDPPVAFRAKLAATIVEHLRSGTESPLELSHFVSLRLSELAAAVRHQIDAFEAWCSRLVENPNIMGGEPVFPGTRLTVRHVGALVGRGAADELREDYPNLSDEDLRFAQIFSYAYPKRGRPVDQASDR